MTPLGDKLQTDVAQVERELAELWREASTEDQAVVRACALNLVVVCGEDESELQEATRRVATISETAPGRALVVAAVPEGGLRVWVSAHCHRGAGGAVVCSEQVTLEANRAGMELVPGTILQLLVEDMPVYTWWRRQHLAASRLPFAPIRDLSDRMIVDGSAWREPVRLAELSAATSTDTWKGHTADVTWARIEPWREALASFFDVAESRTHLERIFRVTVRSSGPAADGGVTAAGAYLAGWLASRMDWSPGTRPVRWQRRDGQAVEMRFELDTTFDAGEVVSVRIDSGEPGSEVTFVAERIEGQGEFVRLSVERDGTGPPSHRLKLPDRGQTALLCGILQQTERDPIYEAALTGAARLVSP